MSLILTLLVALQSIIVVTGGAVRLTGSGLGCPTWPDCVSGSIAPVPHQAQGTLHSWIEFGNRLLTVALFIAIIASLIVAFRKGRGRSDWPQIRLLALLQLAGIVAQIVLGGITVLTKLNPFAVSAHFLLSIVVIAGALSLRQRLLAVKRVQVLSTTRNMIRGLLLLAAFVITLGTVVTGSGPHAGDIQAKRYHISPREISWLHADSVIALIALTFGLYLIIRTAESADNRSYVGRKVLLLIFICLGQGAIGYIQYFTKLPEALVAAHLLGSTLVWLGIWNVGFAADALTASSKKRITK